MSNLVPEVDMGNWLFALVVLGVGVLLAYAVDRMRRVRKYGRADEEVGPKRRERNRWLTYWFTGRFPTSAEEEELEREVREEERKSRDQDEGK